MKKKKGKSNTRLASNLCISWSSPTEAWEGACGGQGKQEEHEGDSEGTQGQPVLERGVERCHMVRFKLQRCGGFPSCRKFLDCQSVWPTHSLTSEMASILTARKWLGLLENTSWWKIIESKLLVKDDPKSLACNCGECILHASLFYF